MCGIIGIVNLEYTKSHEHAIRLLRDLEYRGYDSFGYISDDFEPHKYIGAISKSNIEFEASQSAHITIAHTRWATHGKVNLANTHPHTSNHRLFSIVHNGVISNAKGLREDLKAEGYTFYSDTDTEVIVNIIERAYLNNKSDSPESVIRSAMAHLDGEYALAIIAKVWPDTLVCVKQESPLVLGISSEMCAVTSDEAALVNDFSECIHLEDGDVAVIERTQEGIRVSNIALDSLSPISKDTYVRSSLGEFPDYMSKEMAEIPSALQSAIDTDIHRIEPAERVLITGCGSAYYAAWIGHIFRRMSSPIAKDSLAYPADEAIHALDMSVYDSIIAVSQSGETYDTMQALKNSTRKTVCVTNVSGSTMSRSVTHPIFQNAGPEKCVLSTKSILSQCAILFRLFNEPRREHLISKLIDQWASTFPIPKLTDLAHQFEHIDHFFFIGRGVYVPVAMENALKVKEVTYCHAEGMGAGFFKHGTLSLIDDRFVVFAHLPYPGDENDSELHALTEANISEIEARGGRVVRVGHTDDCDIRLPHVCSELNALLHLGVGQHFAYQMAKLLGRDVDQPRSLAKSVTVR